MGVPPVHGQRTRLRAIRLPYAFRLEHAFRLASQSKRPQIRPTLMVAVLQPEVRKFSIAEYYRLAETGVLLPSERVELLNGQIIRMAPIGEKHRTIVDKLNYIFVDKPRKRYLVSIDQPIRIEDFNEPQPDVFSTKGGSRTGIQHPKTFTWSSKSRIPRLAMIRAISCEPTKKAASKNTGFSISARKR
jgi:hypothetical protein